MAAQGLEHPSNSSGKTGVAAESGAESGALGAQNGGFEPELVEVVAAWPGLAPEVRERIVGLIRGETAE